MTFFYGEERGARQRIREDESHHGGRERDINEFSILIHYFMNKSIVIIRHCATYDVSTIETIVGEGLAVLHLQPHGRTLVKPNCVVAGQRFPHAYTRAEFLEGVLRALKKRARSDLRELAVGERCGITIPTRHAFREAGYYAVFKRTGVRYYHFEEATQREVSLHHEGRLRDAIFIPEPVTRADFFVNCPKFKAHPWTTVTFSMKNYIGIQDDRHRLIDHDYRLNEKVADLQYVLQPRFIAVDGITAGEGRMLTPLPFPLHLIIMGTNQVAVDAVCCRIIGLDPMDVDHIRMAHERGFGPVALESIALQGDVSLDEARERASGFRTGLVRVEDYFRGTNIRAYAGPPPTDGAFDYCWGGCPGAVEEAIEIIRFFDKQTDERIARRPLLHIVFGRYDGPLNVKPGETLVFMGDCAHGRHEALDIDLPSLYQERSTKDPRTIGGSDVYLKVAGLTAQLMAEKNKPYIRIRGCPVSVVEQLIVLVRLLKLKDPLFTVDSALMSSAYLSWRTRSLMRRVMGIPYQIQGPTPRGQARPMLDHPSKHTSTRIEE